jgi:hypothetical protein
MTATSPGASALVVDAGSPWGRSALAAVRALHSAGLRAVVGRPAGQPSLASSSRSCSGTVALPDVNDPGFRCAVAEEVTRASHVVALAASDAALVALDAPGCRLTDKSVVSARAADAGIPVLAEVVVSQGDDLDEALGGLTWPVIAKPLVRRAGDPPAREVGCYEDVVGLLTGRPLLLQRRHYAELTVACCDPPPGLLRARFVVKELLPW